MVCVCVCIYIYIYIYIYAMQLKSLRELKMDFSEGEKN